MFHWYAHMYRLVVRSGTAKEAKNETKVLRCKLFMGQEN